MKSRAPGLGRGPRSRFRAAAPKAGDELPGGDHEFVTWYCENDGYPRVVMKGCGRRSCEFCRRRWYRFHFDSLVALVSGWSRPRLVTLTVKNIPDEVFAAVGRERVGLLRKWFAELRVQLPQLEGGFYAVEVTNHGRGWHLHLHVLYDGGYVVKDELRAAWAKITHGSFIVDIEKASDARGLVGYLLKDLVKAPQIRPEDVDVFDYVFFRAHMIQPFGPHGKTKYRVPRVSCKCPLCGGESWVRLDPLTEEERRTSFPLTLSDKDPPAPWGSRLAA